MTPPEANPLAQDLDEVLQTVGSLWEELRGARIFITGGTGFFGCWLLETLLWANGRLGLEASTVVLTRDARAFMAKAPHLAGHEVVTLHEGDVRSFDFPAGAFTHVIHAATTSSSPVPGAEMFDTIVNGTKRTLEFARFSGARRFLLTSSGAVYGVQPPDVENISEDYIGAPDCTDPRNAYGEGKRAAEMLCAVYASDTLQPTIARCFAFVGPYLPLDAHFAIGNFIRDALAGGPIRVQGDGTPARSYMYGSDLTCWLWTILLRGRSGRAYNVGSERALKILELAALVSGLAIKQTDVTAVSIANAASSAQRYVPSTSRARFEMGLRVRVKLGCAVSRTLEWNSKR